MVIFLKIFLGLLIIAFGYISYFVISEFRKFKKTKESEGNSLLEKFIIGAITFISMAFLGCLIGFSLFLIFSKITIVAPF